MLTDEAEYKATYSVQAKVWCYEGNGAWHFITLPQREAKMVRVLFKEYARPFGSIAVLASIGDTQWRTSIFADTKSNSYVLPLKAEVRRREKIKDGDIIQATVHVL